MFFFEADFGCKKLHQDLGLFCFSEKQYCIIFVRGITLWLMCYTNESTFKKKKKKKKKKNLVQTYVLYILITFN